MRPFSESDRAISLDFGAPSELPVAWDEIPYDGEKITWFVRAADGTLWPIPPGAQEEARQLSAYLQSTAGEGWEPELCELLGGDEA